MKNKLSSLVVSALVFTGCATNKVPIVRDAAYVQNKAQNISQFVGSIALLKNPKASVPLSKALADLKTITAKDTISVDDLITVALTIPQVANSKYGFALSAGQLVLKDELTQLAIDNPTMLRAAAIGMENGLDAALKSAAPPVTP